MTPCLRLASILLLAFFSLGFTRFDDGMVRGRKAVGALMDSVECVMDDNPTYADKMMQRIDSRSFSNKKQKARYALLYTATQYKTYQPFTSDSLIMEAVRFYSMSGSLDYRFLSYYYLGCVYAEMGQMADASVALAQAEHLVDRIDNDYWKGLLYTVIGNIYSESCNYNLADEYFSKAGLFHERAGKEYHRIYALYNKGKCKIKMHHFLDGDSIVRIVQDWAFENKDSALFSDVIYTRFSCYVLIKDTVNSTELYNEFISINEALSSYSSNPYYHEIMALYYNQRKDFSKSELYLNAVKRCNLSRSDSIYLYYISSLIAEGRGQLKQSIDYNNLYISLQNQDIREILMVPILSSQKDYFFALAEYESIKARNRKTILVASIVIFLLIVIIVSLISDNRRREVENRISDNIITINDLTTQISINKDKISKLNAKVREMIRQQFNPSDYLYTRFYEQIDDSKKAERLYRVVKSQLDGFTNHKNISRIDALLNDAFDGIMNKLSLSGLDLREKDMLLIRLVLAGFSAKSIAALLDDTHQNISQRKKRLLDKIEIKAPSIMNDLRIALSFR